jgi:tripartite-type tricarboxylate transporter receptor subunit TctC
MNQLLLIARIGAAFAAAAACASALAQDYPNRPVRVIVPYTTGGQPDIHGRILTPSLGNLLGQSFVLENIPGAGGVAAASAVMSAPADGHAIFLGDSAHWAINPALRPKQPNEFVKNFTPVRMIHTTSVALVVNAAMPVANLKDFLSLVKGKPDTYTYGSAGIGSIGHLTMEAFKAVFGLSILHVPFKSSGQALPAIVGGDVNMIFSGLPAVTGFAKAERVKILGVSTMNRTRLAPNVPSISEFGFPDFDYAGGGAFLVRTGTPRPVIDKLVAALDKTYTLPDVIARLNANNIEFLPQATPESTMATIRADIPRWAAAVKASGATATD